MTNKEKLCSKTMEKLGKDYPQLFEENDYEEIQKTIEDSFDVFKLKYKNEDGTNFEDYILESLINDISMSYGLEDIEIEIDENALLDMGEDVATLDYIKTYEEKYKNIERIISKGSGSLTNEEKDILAAKNIPLIHSIVKRFANTGIEYSELLSAGYVGYAKALQTFAKGKNVKFSTYAYRCIKNEILYFLRREKRHKDNDISLYKPMSTDKNGNVMTVDSTISTEDMGARSVEDEIAISETVKIMLEVIDNYLTPTEALIIKARYGVGNAKPKTQKEIADEIGMSQANVSKLEKGISDKIKKIMSSKYKIKSI